MFEGVLQMQRFITEGDLETFVFCSKINFKINYKSYIINAIKIRAHCRINISHEQQKLSSRISVLKNELIGLNKNYYNLEKVKQIFIFGGSKIVRINSNLYLNSYLDIVNKLKEFVNECNAEQTNIV